MEHQHIPYEETHRFSALVLAYLQGDERLSALYDYSPDSYGLSEALEFRREKTVDRETLVRALRQQYEGLTLSPATQRNLKSLGTDAGFTITTGHQLCLFGGPLYFIYKILTVIRLAEEMQEKHDDAHFIPVFWMASEDHDFEEIAHFRPFGKALHWENDATGAVGRMQVDSLSAVRDELAEILGDRPEAASLLALWDQCYVAGTDLTTATRKLVHALFDAYGVIIVDGDDPALKALCRGIFKEELLQQTSHHKIQAANQVLEEAGFGTQVHSRDINLFYLKDDLRSRIVATGEDFEVLDSSITFTKDELLQELETHPERFSPNVIMRPVYQECILPNIAYVGGGGELAYWLQLREVLHAYLGWMPAVLLRNSLLWLDKGAQKKMDKLQLDVADLFQTEDDLIKQYLHQNTSVELNWTEEQEQLEALYNSMAEKGKQIDPTLGPFIQAELQRQMKALDGVGKRIVRAGKKQEEVALNQIKGLLQKYFPNQGLQERHDHFTALWMAYGEDFIAELKPLVDPLKKSFTVIKD